jgi:hypothetical protein
MTLTPAQRVALQAAHAYGCANRYATPSGSMPYPYRVSRFAMFDRLAARGLLRYGPLASGSSVGYRITEAGLAALAS